MPGYNQEVLLLLCIMLEMFASLRHKNFRLFWSGQLISLTGNWMLVISLGWLVFSLTNSSFYLGLVHSISYLPFLFFSLPGGVLADRMDKRKVMIVCQTTAMLSALIMAALIGFRAVNLWYAIAFAATFGSAFALDAPSRQSIVFDLVGKSDLTNAIALNSALFNLSRIAGPAIAGLLIEWMGLGTCFLAGGLAFSAILLALFGIPSVFNNNGHSHLNGKETVHDIYDGFRYVWEHKEILNILIIVASLTIFILPNIMLMPVFAKDILHAGARGLGFLMSATGIGALIGALALAEFSKRINKLILMLIAAIVVFFALYLFSCSTVFWLSLSMLVFLGLGMVILMANTNTLIQELSGDDYRGRVLSIYLFISGGAVPFGSFTFGYIASKIGVPYTAKISSIMFIVTIIFTLIHLLRCCRVRH
jgi:MFS family permease